MYNALKNKFLEKDSANKNVLAISRSSSFGRLLGLRAAIYTEADYPEYNMLSLKFPDNSFDFCVSDQVLEHVEGNPYAAFHETARVGWIGKPRGLGSGNRRFSLRPIARGQSAPFISIRHEERTGLADRRVGKCPETGVGTHFRAALSCSR